MVLLGLILAVKGAVVGVVGVVELPVRAAGAALPAIEVLAPTPEWQLPIGQWPVRTREFAHTAGAETGAEVAQ